MSSIGYDRDRAEARARKRFQAQYPGRCENCGGDIEVGDTLRWDGEVAVHDDCDRYGDLAAPDDSAETTEVCPRCFLAISVSGKCGCDS